LHRSRSSALRIARGSVEETRGWVQDGVDRAYFTTDACRRAEELADDAGRLTTALIVSLSRFVNDRRTRGPGTRDQEPGTRD